MAPNHRFPTPNGHILTLRYEHRAKTVSTATIAIIDAEKEQASIGTTITVSAPTYEERTARAREDRVVAVP